MSTYHEAIRTTPILLLVVATLSFGQAKSAVQFYDTTGQTKTGKIGWSGNAADGHFFIQTPTDGEVLKTRNGGVDVSGTVRATNFIGDGSQLTNLPAAPATVGSVAGLSDSLAAKAKASDVSALSTAVAGKADASVVSSKVDSAWVMGKIPATGSIADGSVSSAKLADDAVTTAKIATSAVTDAKIAGVTWGKITGKPAAYRSHSDSITWKTGTAGQVWKMGASGPDWSTDLQGASGATTIPGITGLTDSLANHRSLINSKANTSDLTAKANAADVYTKTSVDALVAEKADAAEVYSKEEVNTRVAAVAGGDGNQRTTNTAVIAVGDKISATSVTLNIPEAGYILAFGTATVKAVGTDYTAVDCSITTSSTTMQEPVNSQHWYSNSPSVANTMACSRFISVPQGPITLYFLFEQIAGSAQIFKAQLNCVFTKQVL